MNDATPDTLKELHRIREQIYEEERHLSPRERVERTRRAADALLKQWGLNLKRVSPPARTVND
jgi:hypothetical protein